MSTNTATNNISIDTGLIRIMINGGPAYIEFNPHDVLFAEKFYALMKDFSLKQIEYRRRSEEIDNNKSVDVNGVPSNYEDGLKLVHEMNDFTRKGIDTLFGEGTSDKVFGKSFVLEAYAQFFEGILPYVQQARTDKIAQYTTDPSVLRNTRKHSRKK